MRALLRLACWCGLALAVALLASGCATSSADTTAVEPRPAWTVTPKPTAPARIVPARCPNNGAGLFSNGPQVKPGAPPAGFVAVKAMRCYVTDIGDHRQPENRYTIVQESAPMTARLAHALSLPNQTPPPPPRVGVHWGCPADGVGGHTMLLLVSASGDAYRPVFPQTFCYRPRPAVGKALSHMNWHTDRTFHITRPDNR